MNEHPSDTTTSDPATAGEAERVSRRGLLGAAGAGLAAIGIGACTYAVAPRTTASPLAPAPQGQAGASGAPAASMTPMPGMTGNDASAADVVTRFVGGEWEKVTPYGNQPLAAKADGDWKRFDLTIDPITHRLDAVKPAIAALGFNGTWPGPLLRVIEGDRVRVVFANRLPESTGVHFHGQRVPNKMDGVPLVTQDPIKPGDTFAYEFVARVSGSHMYHSHHNATDQVGRGLLGAFIVDPKDPNERPDRKYGVTQDIVWISNDALGGFTINGRGFPATKPLVAKLGEKLYVRFMNEGVMTHPWHLHGTPMRIVARDGYPLGSAAFTCDTLGVNPGERWDALIDCDEPGVWAFHCHVLPHAEGPTGMFGMVTALIVTA